MGLCKSKITLNSIRTEVEKINNNLQDGHIAINEKEHYEKTLKLSIREIRKSKYRASKRRIVHQMINNTLHELSRQKVKYNTKKNVKTIQEMSYEIGRIRALVKKKVLKLPSYERLERTLVFYDKKVNEFSFDVSPKEIKAVHKEIAMVNEEVLNKKAAVQLDEIEERLEILTNRMKTAQSKKKIERSSIIEQSLQALVQDLQAVAAKDLYNEQRKNVIEKGILKLYEQLEKVRTQNIAPDEVETQNSLDILQELEEEVNLFNANLNENNFQTSQDNYEKFKTRLESVEDHNQKVILKKGEVSDALLFAENNLTRLEMENKLKQAENIFDQLGKHFHQSADTSQQDSYLKEFDQLKCYVNQILEVNYNVSGKKMKLINNIDKYFDAKCESDEENETKLLNLSEVSNIDVPQIKITAPDDETKKKDSMNETNSADIEGAVATEDKDFNGGVEQIKSTTLVPEPKSKNTKNERIITDIERGVEQLKPKVESFVGLISSSEYFELDETLMEFTLKLDSLKFDTSSNLHNRKIELLKLIEELNIKLDANAEEAEEKVRAKEIETIENETSQNTETLGEIPHADYPLEQTEQIEKMEEEVNEVPENVTSSAEIVVLDLTAKDTEEIEKLEKSVHELAAKITSFDGQFGDGQYQELCEEVEEIGTSMTSMKTSHELKERKDICAKKFLDCVAKLSTF